MSQPIEAVTVAPAELSTLPRRRRWVNAVTQQVVAIGGGAVIAAIALIFIYLLWVVAPVFSSAEVSDGPTFTLPAAEPIFIEVNESGELAFRVTAAGAVEVFELARGDVRSTLSFGRELRMVKRVYPHSTLYAVLDAENQLTVLEASYPVSFEGAERRIDSRIEPVFGDEWLPLGDVDDFDSHYRDFTFTVAVLNDRTLTLQRYRDAERGYELEFPRESVVTLDADYQRVLFGPRGATVYLTSASGDVEILDINRFNAPAQLYQGRLVPSDSRLTSFEPLLGRYSLLAADDSGTITQWFLVRGEFGPTLEPIRSFELDETIVKIVPEQRRKGFVAIDARAGLHLLYTTSGRTLTSHQLRTPGLQAATVAPRANLLLTAANDGSISAYELDNKHPDISLSALWSKVWYEGYDAPVYSWQSSSADNDFEPKFSLTPLLFGTIKAAFYAMLVAVPVAIMGAIYTAYFMAPVMRRIVKPGIEIMAALPTVILGFLAGLWLAPLVEANLAAVITILLVLPAAITLVSLLWLRLPDTLRETLDGWYGLIIVPVILVAVVGAFWFGPVLESTFFGGDSRAWFLENLGLDYDQRNALVVGLAMGLAVVPTIFSLAEDAIYGVPTHLINGSLALGATRWQTLIRVVILTASPGIFSAIMIGLGRAVGETMIVLMATGNTPVMDWNIFQGMRTFAANIAVELPESEVGSSHYRILFLAALVLFLITFAFNTIAEVVRQRLRERYGSL